MGMVSKCVTEFGYMTLVVAYVIGFQWFAWLDNIREIMTKVEWM